MYFSEKSKERIKVAGFFYVWSHQTKPMKLVSWVVKKLK
jgi:hypothetical protein